MNIGSRNRGRSGAGVTRAERRAEARRSRAHHHLRRVRGHSPTARPGRRLYVATTAVAAMAGALAGMFLADSAAWDDRENGAIFVHGAEHLSAAEIAAAARTTEPGVGNGTTGPDAVAAQVARHPWIATARALALPSGDLLLEVTEAVPVAVAAVGENDALYLVDAAGVPFAPADAAASEGLLRLRVSDVLSPNEANGALAAAVAVAENVRSFELGRPLAVHHAIDGPRRGYAVRLEGVEPWVLLGDQELNQRLETLSEILARGLPGLADATELDLRFAGQAVLRNEPSHEGAAQAAATRGRAAPST